MRIVLFAFAFAACLTTVAQENEPSSTIRRRPAFDYRTAISFNPLALVQIDYTILAGLEYRVKPAIGLALEGGYIFGSGYSESGDNGPLGTNASGFILRPSARFYVSERRNFYLQPQIFYKQVTHRETDWVGYDCVDDVPSYSQLQDYKFRRSVYGFNATAGFLVNASRNRTAFLDFYFGLGFRHKKTAVVDIPRGCLVNDRSWTFEDGTYPSLPLGIKLVFVIQ